MVKAIIGLMVVGGIALGVVYFVGGVSSYDPEAQGRAAKAAIRPGMTWKQVVDVTKGGPKTYQTILPPEREGRLPKPGARVKWERGMMETELKDNIHKLGFLMNFPYTANVAFDVVFDPNGVVIAIEDQRTVADLLDNRKK